MVHVVSFSTGLSSALAVERVIARYGADQTHIVAMDTLMEDDDNYRFAAEVQDRWDRLYGARIHWLTEGRTPYQVMKDKRFIGNSRVATCTFILKINLFYAHLATRKGPITVHIGYDYTEMHRVAKTREGYEDRGYAVDFPLLWKPYETRPYSDVVRQEWGIEPPRMYNLGFKHANCGGVCVKQGKAEWILTLRTFPERYRAIEEWEQDMQAMLGKPYTILREYDKGDRVPLSLRHLRERVELSQNEVMDFSDDDLSGCGVSCGIGIPDTDEDAAQ